MSRATNAMTAQHKIASCTDAALKEYITLARLPAGLGRDHVARKRYIEENEGSVELRRIRMSFAFTLATLHLRVLLGKLMDGYPLPESLFGPMHDTWIKLKLTHLLHQFAALLSPSYSSKDDDVSGLLDEHNENEQTLAHYQIQTMEIKHASKHLPALTSAENPSRARLLTHASTARADLSGIYAQLFPGPGAENAV